MGLYDLENDHGYATEEMGATPLSAHSDLDSGIPSTTAQPSLLEMMRSAWSSSGDTSTSTSTSTSAATQPTVLGGRGSGAYAPSTYQSSFERENNNNNNSTPPAGSTQQQADDHSFAWLLQQMEFEVPFETEEDAHQRELNGDFEGKEYRASKCKNQMRTLSTLLVVIQICLFWAMCKEEGMDENNPMSGPSGLALVEWGAKDTALIVYRGDWWRILTPIMMHAGVLHLLSNALIQLRVGGYLNIVFGNMTFCLVYLLSGVFGNICSCIFIPEGVSVGSSGALLGILGAWSVWIIFRWNKIPEPLHNQRNCQLSMVIVCITVTLATSFASFVDWAAHFGGCVMGAVLGLVLLSHELDNKQTQLFVRVTGVCIVIALFSISLWYLAIKVRPSKDVLAYYDYYGVS